jgi:hypothetical protein
MLHSQFKGLRLNWLNWAPVMGTEFNQDEIDVAKLRERLRQMNDTELRSFGRDALYMTSVTRRESFVIQVEEAREELKRRNELRRSKTKNPAARQLLP